jgi:predicted acylesterase/phospholipase RssA
MVFAMSRYNMNAGIPCIFRSYQGTANQMPDCAIWEVLCATMAHPELFKSIDIGEPPMRESFVDGGMGCSNPIAHALAEAKTLFPDRHVASVMSIGAGHARTIQIPKSSMLGRALPMNVLMAMKDIAMDSERAAQEMVVRFQRTTDVYFRFNVDQGLQNVKLNDWERLNEVSAHTRAYMRRAETSGRMDQAVRAIVERKTAISTAQIGKGTFIF